MVIAKMVHCNLNVTDLDRSIAFYHLALGLEVQRRMMSQDGSFSIVYLGDGRSEFALELTWLRDHPQPYELGENESHIAFAVDDYDGAHARHAEMGCICYENTEMGLYFIHDPDGYWLEILPARRQPSVTAN